MKPIKYQRNWGAKQTEEEEMAEKFGILVHEVDESAEYDEDKGKLFRKGRKYNVIFTSGCSCWAGDWEGWGNLTLTELRKLAKTWIDSGYGSEKVMGNYVLSEMGKI